ncbi:efflux RND transporter periplasmic adaptor subunit [Pseudomonas sp. RIT-PI-AD]|uniref:efflux RND transporter periplasmic adaptor subunit n=1 Tax=Pseudomonas sp. RIT-PI-AD TaxID=3035294 RepID=UPI0021D997DC|nr:efflux RND transporter periplasmic adaptor subunit [Pseudomonas sp. RIT-PI-AD]
MQSRSLKVASRLTVPAVLTTVLLWSWLKPAQSAPGTPPSSATSVALARVQRVSVVPQLDAIGQIEAGRQVLISPEVAGNVIHLSFDSGQSVRAGQVLARLNDGPEQAQLTQLQAEFTAASARLQRQRELLATGGTSRQVFEDAQVQHDTARAALEHLRAVIAQKYIKAPFDGTLGLRQVDLGQHLDPGAPITSLTDLSQLRVNFTVAEQEGGSIRQDQGVSVQVDAWPGVAFSGRISAIDPRIENTHTISVQAILDDPDRKLRPGMYARVQVALPAREALLIPETAVAYSAYGEFAFVARAGENEALTVKRINLRIGEHRDGQAQVLEGLSEGQQVVVSGQLRLRDGMAVRPVASALGI